MKTRTSTWRHMGWFCLGLSVLTLAVFSPTLTHGFVNYDDPDYVTRNAHVQSGLTWPGVVWAFSSFDANNWHPLTWLSHMLDYQLYGPRPAGHHLTSLLLHAASTLLLFLVMRRLTGAQWQSACVAALFGLHPLHVESVAWVAERKDVLSGFFFMLTLWFYSRYAEAQRAMGEKRRASKRNRTPAASAATFPVTRYSSFCYWVALLFFTLGLMSKAMLVTLPFVLLLLDYWPLQRFHFSSPSSQRSTLPRLLAEKVPFLVLGAIDCVLTLLAQSHALASVEILPFSTRAANAAAAYLHYLSAAVVPHHLAVFYPYPLPPSPTVIAGQAIVLALVSWLVIRFASRRPYLFVGWLWYLGTLVPVIGLIQVGQQACADRYTYLPLIGFFIMLTFGFNELYRLRVWRRAVLVASAALGLGACALLTVRQLQHWRNSETLFRHAVEVTHDNYLAHGNLGVALAAAGRSREASEQYETALRLCPSYAEAHNNLGVALAEAGRTREAIEQYETALRIRPSYAEAHNNLGLELAQAGKRAEAIEHYAEALRLRPENPGAHNNLGIVLAATGRTAEAIGHYQAAVRLQPDLAEAHYNLGLALEAENRMDEAVEYYRKSLDLLLGDPRPRHGLGRVLAAQGKIEEAIEQFTAALRLNPDDAELHYHLGLALARQGKRPEAAAQFGEALRLNPGYGPAREQLEALSAKR